MEENLFHCIPQRRKTSSIVLHNRGKPLPLYPTIEENLFHCGIPRKKTCSVALYNGEDFSVLYPLMRNNFIVLSYSSVLYLLQRKVYCLGWEKIIYDEKLAQNFSGKSSITVLDTKSQNSPEVVVVRRGVAGFWKFGWGGSTG
jgi:hypothetical protein